MKEWLWIILILLVLAIIASVIATAAPTPDCRADLNHDGQVDTDDWSIMRDSLGMQCPNYIDPITEWRAAMDQWRRDTEAWQRDMACWRSRVNVDCNDI